MAVETRAELVEALVLGEPHRVIGTAETAWLDFKRDGYELGTPRGRWEFVKDVTALAHKGGPFSSA
jgi:hypothetical protein